MGDKLAVRKIPDITRRVIPDKIPVPEKEYEIIFSAMVNAFHGNRVGCETLEGTKEYVKRLLRESIEGMKYRNGSWTIWKKCPAASKKEIKKLGWREALNKRLRTYHYDLNKGFLGNPHTNKPIKVGLRSLDDPSNPNRLKLSADDKKEMEEYKAKLLTDFPQLNSISDKSGIEALAFWHIKNKKLIRENGMIDDKHIKIYKELTDTLGISGSKRKAIKEETSEGTLEELHKIYKTTKKDYPEIEEDYIKEEFALLWQKYQNNSITRKTFDAWIRLEGYDFKTDEEFLKFINE